MGVGTLLRAASIASFVDDFLEFIYPHLCFLCEARHDGKAPLCPACRRMLRFSARANVQHGKGFFHELSGELFLDKAVTVWDFSPELENLIHLVKYQNRRRLGRFLGRLAGRSARSALPSRNRAVLVPVPLHRTRQRERGYNQSACIGEGLSGAVGLPLLSNALARIRHTRTQTKLTAEEREKNVGNAFSVRLREAVEGKTVVLADDVITTGATVNACAKALKRAGASEVIGFALARPQMAMLGVDIVVFS